MKITLHKWLVGVAALTFAAGCSNEDAPAIDTPDVPDKTPAEAYVNIRLDMPKEVMSRDGDYAPGTEDEQKLSTVLILFYDNEVVNNPESGNSGNPIAYSLNFLPGENIAGAGDIAFGRSNTVELTYNDGFSVADNSKITQVAVLVNPDFDGSHEWTKMAFTLVGYNMVSLRDDKPFTMSSAGYIDNNGKYQISVPFDGTTQIYSSKSEAASSSPVTLYVERLATKVTVPEIKEVNPIDVNILSAPEGRIVSEAATITFEAKNWVTTNTGIMSCVFKHLNVNLDTWMYPQAGDDGYGHRTFWAYPTDISTQTKDNAVGIPFTKNLSTTAAYVNERTFGKPIDYSEVPSVVIRGDYVVKQGDETKTYANGFYIRPRIADGTRVYDLIDIADLVDVMAIDVTPRVLCDAQGEAISLSGILEAVHYDKKLNDATVDVPANGYTLSLTSGALTGTTLYYRNASGQPEAVTAANAGEVNKMLEAKVGYVKKYLSATEAANGSAFYFIPLRHRLRDSGNNPYIAVADQEVGDYGIVRNHWYELTVNSITGLAIGAVPGSEYTPDPEEEENYSIDVRISFMKWHLLDQDIDL